MVLPKVYTSYFHDSRIPEKYAFMKVREVGRRDSSKRPALSFASFDPCQELWWLVRLRVNQALSESTVHTGNEGC